ncbi:GAF domain-containing sensor histidine kinase [Massilia sp. S19_KUP03_FR1]|uniref:GAF domain-containing sensor histidine kinase n=1 Tax=Massilia sp. S19_KUP03_FR1 TaxID=3025503 RepID=UPI002FCDB26F
MKNRLERLEAVQAMLLEIGQLSMSCTDISQFVSAVHRALGRIMYAANFYVALSERDDDAVRFVYFVDEVDVGLVPGPDTCVKLGTPEQSPTVWVIQHREKLTLTAEDFRQRAILNGNQIVGSVAQQWMGCPLLDQHHQALGAIVIQSYALAHRYSAEDEALFGVIANHVSVALQGLQSVDRLERAVHERTEMLERQNAALRDAQSELVRQEKLASLGRLVAGVAHEINTPLGICVTATSHLVQELKLTREELAAGEMTAESLESFFDIIDQSLRIMTTNTQRAAALVRSFKQVAVDQSSDAIRSFNLLTYLNEVLLSLQPKLKGRPVKVTVDCPADVVLDSFPGAVSQIVTNMVVNSLVHGFEHEQAGNIRLHAACANGMVEFAYSDDGAGMDADTLGKLFDPFFTTRRGTGGSGLGAHILYNLATGPLGGTIRVESAPGQGLKYWLRFPQSRRVEKAAL